jgi:hypothetical protein
VKALGGAGERWLHWACSVQSKATSDDYCGVVVRCAGLVADLAWLLVFSILGREQKRSGKAARVMQEAADSWEEWERLGANGSEWERMGLDQSQRWQWQWEAKRSEAKASPCPGCVGCVSVCWWTTSTCARGPRGLSETTLTRRSVIGHPSGRVQNGSATTRWTEPALVQQQRYGGDGALSCDSCQRWEPGSLGAVLPAGIGRDSRLHSADGTASVSLPRLIRRAYSSSPPRLYLDTR